MADLPEIKGFKFVSKLAEGGMATVYLGIQENLNRNVAIKILAPSLFLNKETTERFKKEAEIAANLNHSNIVQIIQSGEIGDSYFIIMEYLEESLKDWMKRSPRGKMTPEIAFGIIEEIMKALDYAHFKGVYHRDIKPDNIMFRQDTTPVLVDFGIARLYEAKNRLTKEGQIMGTVDYISPEQCKAKKDIDGRSDIYSLGVVLFEMLTGKKPYEGTTQISIALQHIEKPVPTLPEDLAYYQPIIDTMMAKDRDQRLSSGAQFTWILDKLLKRTSGHAPMRTLSNVPLSIDHSVQSQETTPKDSSQTNQAKPETQTKQLFNKFKVFLEEKLHIYRAFSPQKKVLFGLIPVALLLIVIFSSIWIADINAKNERREKQFQEKYTIALQCLNSGNYVDAELLVVELKKIKNKKEINDLEKRITQFKETQKANFEEKYKQAVQYLEDGNYDNAEPLVEELKFITYTQEIKALEEKILQLKKSEEDRFQEKYNTAMQYVEKEDYENASLILEELKKIRSSNETQELQKEISRLKNTAFNKYLSRAYLFFKKKNYAKARALIIQAKKIKTTIELIALEESIDSKFQKKRSK